MQDLNTVQYIVELIIVSVSTTAAAVVSATVAAAVATTISAAFFEAATAAAEASLFEATATAVAFFWTGFIDN